MVYHIIGQPFSAGGQWMMIENRPPEQQPPGITLGRQIFTLKQLGLPENLNRHHMPKQ